jgi:hypothetical protein
MSVIVRSRRFSPIAIVIVVFVVAIVSFGGWYVWRARHQNQKANPSSDETNSNTPAQTKQTQSGTNSDNGTTAPPIEQSDQHGGWKTYASKVGSFSFKYPSDWAVTDTTAGSNEYLRLFLESPTRPYGKVILMFDVIKKSLVSQYEVGSDTRTLENNLRLWTKKMPWTSKHYNELKPFDCARIRILEAAKNEDVNLPGDVFLSSEGGFCMNQDDYTTKSYPDQLKSTEMEDAVKVYESISINN